MGNVDYNDFAILANDWMKTGPGLEGDTNWSNTVDLVDLLQIAEHWLQ